MPLLLPYNILLAQSTETEKYICWSEGVILDAEDFQGKVGDCGAEIVDSIKIKASACLGIWSILDIPKTWKKGEEYERFYFAPVFDKTKSWTTTNDSFEILKQKVYLDLSELVARGARRQLYELRKETGNATGTTAIYYSTIKQKMESLRLDIYSGYFNAVIRSNNIDSLHSWVSFTQEMLETNKEYATKPSEFQRLLTGNPEKGYKQAKKIMGPLGPIDENNR